MKVKGKGQIRNRLVERAKYLLPTTADGTVILNHRDLIHESAKRFGDGSTKNRLLKFVDSKSEKRPRRNSFFSASQFLTNFQKMFVYCKTINL